VGRFLGPNISNFYRAWPLERVVQAWNAAGLVEVGHKSMSVGGGIVMWGRKRDA
jgi:demethylmenaquinone methyltransferase/2-methoxy-6-polyprenyl-1,4-benzoquinol methylase